MEGGEEVAVAHHEDVLLLLLLHVDGGGGGAGDLLVAALEFPPQLQPVVFRVDEAQFGAGLKFLFLKNKLFISVSHIFVTLRKRFQEVVRKKKVAIFPESAKKHNRGNLDDLCDSLKKSTEHTKTPSQT